MKIHESLRLNQSELSKTKTEKNTDIQMSFQKVVANLSNGLTKDRLDRLLSDIDKQGESLAKNSTVPELRKYKSLIKQFMDEVKNSRFGLYQSDTWDPHSGSKTLKTVQTIDKKLTELAEQVLNQQKDRIDILDRIGEIKGLLINLYT